MNKFLTIVTLFGFVASAIAAEPSISVEARQRYPWNGLVDLKFTISGASGTKYDTSFAAKDMVGGTNLTMKTIRKSDGSTAAAKELLLPGTYNWVWDAAADLPKDFVCDCVTVMGTADLSAFPYTVKFNANGGTGTMANESFVYGTAKTLTANSFTRTGYTFQGWATSTNGAKVYNDKQSVMNLVETSGGVVNLYAVWKEIVRDKVQLWAGGPYWATTNIGAEKPEDYGYYFWWGDTVGYKRVGSKWVASDGSNSNFSFSESNTPTYNKSISTLKNEGWITSDGVLAPEHDAATVHWGNGWRLPTTAEFDALINNCVWTWATQNGVKGYVIKGRGAYASNSIFLPVAGYGNGTSLNFHLSYGYYWSSVLESDNYYAWYLYFSSSSHGKNGCFRCYGHSVRPVLGFTK